jgi:hypothetical protein
MNEYFLDARRQKVRRKNYITLRHRHAVGWCLIIGALALEVAFIWEMVR